MINIYALKIFRGGMIKLSKRGHHAIVTSVDDKNRGWMERFDVVTPGDILQALESFIPESWNYTRKFLQYHSFTMLKGIPLFTNFPFIYFSHPLGSSSVWEPNPMGAKNSHKWKEISNKFN